MRVTRGAALAAIIITAGCAATLLAQSSDTSAALEGCCRRGSRKTRAGTISSPGCSRSWSDNFPELERG